MTDIQNPVPSIDETIAFIKTAHAGQTDREGVDYWRHVVSVMNRLPAHASDDARHAALLHDVVEDTPYTLDDLAGMGYSSATLDIVDLVTIRPDDQRSYAEKIDAVIASGNIGAIMVKYADMSDNADPARMVSLPETDKAYFAERYSEPLRKLKAALS